MKSQMTKDEWRMTNSKRVTAAPSSFAIRHSSFS